MEIAEIFKSIEGETSYVGLPCTFVRFGKCDLDCSYCDTRFAQTDFQDMSVEEIVNEVEKLNCKLICLTGGEPLLQKDLGILIEKLTALNYKMLLETNGANSIKDIPENVSIILDIKCPKSGMSEKNDWDNLNYISKKDEVKFVITDESDFHWAIDIVRKYNLCTKTKVMMSPIFVKMNVKDLIKLILDSGEEIRLNLQIHKYIWGSNKRGV